MYDYSKVIVYQDLRESFDGTLPLHPASLNPWVVGSSPTGGIFLLTQLYKQHKVVSNIYRRNNIF